MFKSTLDQEISKFNQKINDRSEKIKGRIRELEDQENAIVLKVQQLTKQLINADMEDDAAACSKLNQEIKTLRGQASELQDTLSLYRESKYDSYQLADDLENIRKTAYKNWQERYKAADEKYQLANDIEKKIDELKKELDQTRNEASRLRDDHEYRKLMSVLQYIEPKATNIKMHQDKERFLSTWVQGEDASHLLPEENGPVKPQPIDCCTSSISYTPSEEQQKQGVCVGRESINLATGERFTDVNGMKYSESPQSFSISKGK